MATITKTVPRQHSGSGNSIEIPMQRRSVRMCAKDGGALPDTGFPRGDGMATGNMQETRRAWCKREHFIHHMHSSTGAVPAVIPSKRVSLGWIEFKAV